MTEDRTPNPTGDAGRPADGVLGLLESFVEELPCGAVLVSGDAVRLNRAAEAALQVRRAEVTTVGQWFKQVSGAQAEANRHAYAQARAGGHTWSPEPFVVAGDTGPRQIELASYRFDGVCEVWVLHDVTPRREAEERAARSQQEFEAVVNTAVDAIITIDEDGEIQSFNQAATGMFGYDADEAIGQNVRILMPEPHASRHDAYIKRYLDTGEARIIGRGREVLARRRDGTTFPADLAVSEIDHSRRFTGVVRDLTSRRDLERRLVDSQYATRRTLARELHDGMGGTMAGIGMLAATLSAQLRKYRVAAGRASGRAYRGDRPGQSTAPRCHRGATTGR